MEIKIIMKNSKEYNATLDMKQVDSFLEINNVKEMDECSKVIYYFELSKWTTIGNPLEKRISIKTSEISSIEFE